MHMDINEILNQEGNIYTAIQPETLTTFISKISNINFQTNISLFDKGRDNDSSFYEENKETIPNINFWNQRYYYFSKFDEGIQLDYESILTYNI